MNEKQNKIKEIWDELTKKQQVELLVELIDDSDHQIINEEYGGLEKRGNTINFGSLSVCPLCKR